MNIAFYINELLYRYPCVIVPNFGAFLTERYNAYIDESSQSICPPGKRVFFNAYIQNNDGLLANYLLEKQIGTFEDNQKLIANQVAEWKEQLSKGEKIDLEQIGTLHYNDQEAIVFEPKKTNFDKSSFGLSQVVLSKENQTEETVVVTSQISEEKAEETPVLVIPEFEREVTEPIVTEETNNKRSFGWLKYAAIFLIALMVIGYFGQDYYQNYVAKEKVIVHQKVDAMLEETIQEATFDLGINAESLILNAEKKVDETVVKNFHIVGGAFKSKTNAQNAVNDYKKLGFDSRLGAVNKYGMTHALYGSFETEADAQKTLRDIKQNHNPDAWLLVMPL